MHLAAPSGICEAESGVKRIVPVDWEKGRMKRESQDGVLAMAMIMARRTTAVAVSMRVRLTVC